MEDSAWTETMSRFRDHLVAERDLAPLTVRNYLSDLKPLRDFMSSRNVEAFSVLDRRAIRGYLSWLHQLGYERPSISRKLSALRTLFRWLNREGIAEHDPLPPRGSFKLDSRLPRFLSQDEAAKLMDAPDPTSPKGIRDRALLELVYATGLRVSEVSGLNMDSIDLDTRELRITGKGSKERIALMGLAARNAVKTYVQEVRSTVASLDGGRRAVRQPLRRTPEPAQHTEGGERIRRARRAGNPCPHAHAAPLLRNASARRRRRSQGGSGPARTRQPGYHTGLYAHHQDRGEKGVHGGAPEGEGKSEDRGAGIPIFSHYALIEAGAALSSMSHYQQPPFASAFGHEGVRTARAAGVFPSGES